MTVEHVELLVEEPSMEVALRAILPKVLGHVTFDVYRHQCKAELLERLPERMRGYKGWLPPTFRVVVLVDRDDDDCKVLKAKLERSARGAGLVTRTTAKKGSAYQVVNRVVVEELEAWFFGDWDAVRSAYPRLSATIPTQTKYREPDAVRGGTWEAFERVLQAAGYFKGGLRKTEAAREIAPHMDPARNTSRSFRVLLQALTELRSLG